MQDPKNRQKFAIRGPSHNFIRLDFATKACIDNWKNLLNSNISPTRPHNTVNFGLLMAETRSGVWGTPERVSHLGSVTAWHSSSGRQPNCGAEHRAPPIFGRADITFGN